MFVSVEQIARLRILIYQSSWTTICKKNFCQMDLPYFSVQAKKSQEQSAMLDASDPLDRGKMSKASSLLMVS